MPNEVRLSVDILDPINKAALVRAVKLRYYKAIMKAKPKIENDLKKQKDTFEQYQKKGMEQSNSGLKRLIVV